MPSRPPSSSRPRLLIYSRRSTTPIVISGEYLAMDGCDASHIPVDAEELASIVNTLKILEHRLHYEDSLAPPTVHEIVLYSLILRHVSISCFLFLQEQTTSLKGLPRVPTKDGGHAAFKIDENLSSFCCKVQNKVLHMCLMHDTTEPVKDWRSSTLKVLFGEPNPTYAPEVVSEARGGHGRQFDDMDCEDILVDVLQGLDDCWRRRSYAAPSVSEIGRYREIRKLLVSCLCCIEGKLVWTESFGDPRSPFATPPSEDIYGGIYGVPQRYNFAVTEDLLRDLTCLMTECRHHPFDILALKEAANPKPEPLPRDMAFVPVSDMDVNHCRDYRCMEYKTRLAHLQDILHEMQNINPRPFTVDDFRFYMLLLEHAESAIWHGENETAGHEQMQHSVVSEQARDCGRFVSLLEDSEDSRSSRTQEQSVWVIISILEHIKSHWLATPPTHEEYLCYIQIRDVLRDKRYYSITMSDFGVASLQKEDMEDGIQQFLDETMKSVDCALRELQLDEEAMTGCLKDPITMPANASSGSQDVMERIDRAALMMFKKQVVVDRMVYAMSDVLSTLYDDLESQRITDLSEQAAIFSRVPF